MLEILAQSQEVQNVNGVHAIVIPHKDSVTVTSDAIKTSAGALNTIPVCQKADLSAVVSSIKRTWLTNCSFY